MSQYSSPYPLVLSPEPAVVRSAHPPRVLFLYGSLRERSYSRLLAEEAARIISGLVAEVRFFDPRELPVFAFVGISVRADAVRRYLCGLAVIRL